MEVGNHPPCFSHPVRSHNELLFFPRHCGSVTLFAMTTNSPITPFDCPSCGAQYKLVRTEAGAVLVDRQITCRSCGAPLEGRDGRFILKYFLVNRPKGPSG